MHKFGKVAGMFLALLMVFGLVAFTGQPAEAKDNGSTSRVRVAHLSPDTPAVDIYVNDNKVLSGVTFKTVSDYLTVPSGQYNFKVRLAGAPATSQPAINANAFLARNESYTVAAIGFLANIKGKVYQDPRFAFNQIAAVEVIHASPDAPAVDVVAVLNFGSFKIDFPLVLGLTFTNNRELFLPTDTYNLEIRVAGTKQVVKALPGVKLDGGKVYTVIAANRVANFEVLVKVTEPLPIRA